MANERAEKMIGARKRHFEDMLLKKNHYYNVMIAEERQRETNAKRRVENMSAIYERRKGMMSANRKAKEDQKMDIEHERSKEKLR